MGLSSLAKGALLVLGVGVLSEKYGAGKGLAELGGGVQAIAAAPMTGLGTGLSSLATGVSDIGGAFGDIGRGIADILAPLTRWGGGAAPGLPGWIGQPPLIPAGGGSGAGLQAGGGGNVNLPGSKPVML